MSYGHLSLYDLAVARQRAVRERDHAARRQIDEEFERRQRKRQVPAQPTSAEPAK